MCCSLPSCCDSVDDVRFVVGSEDTEDCDDCVCVCVCILICIRLLCFIVCVGVLLFIHNFPSAGFSLSLAH